MSNTQCMMAWAAGSIFTGAGGLAGGTNYLVATTDLAFPMAEWLRVATNQFDLAGNFHFSNVMPVGISQRFHRLQLPQVRNKPSSAGEILRHGKKSHRGEAA